MGGVASAIRTPPGIHGGWARSGVRYAAFAAAALWILAPARAGEFISDDLPNVLYNPYVQELSPENLGAILDPGGAPAAETFNYAPLHTLALALEWRLFGEDVRGYHVAQALTHAGAAALLAALLGARGLAFPAATLVGALFLVHPANVEAAAWIFQIKTTGALALALAALLLHPRRPGAALACFGLALLTKASAAFALPMAAVFTWIERDPRGPWRSRAGWLAGWALLLVPYAWVELAVLGRMSAQAPLHPDPWVAARTIVAIAGRYLWMAATGWGVAPSHQPARALSALDPWWLAGLLALCALSARAIFALARRWEESAWWVGAAAAWLPTAQIGVRFLHPMADRYLYFALPGLLGGCAFALRDAWERRADRAPAARRMAAAGGVLAVAVLGLFSWRSHTQAAVWRSPLTLAMASAARYPEGLPAQLLAAQRGALRGDAAETVRALRAAAVQGYDRYEVLAGDPVYDAVRRDPAFAELLREMAAAWVEQSLRLAHPTQADLLARAGAYRALGDFEAASAALDEALRLGGPDDARVRLERLRLRSSGR